MDFGMVLELVGGFLDARGYSWAVIGGLAMAAYGNPRTTMDVDLVVDAGTQEDLVSFLEGAGYGTLHRSTGYSNHLHPESVFGRVDVVYVRGATLEKIFGNIREVPVAGDRKLSVPKPEHLVAMKAFAMKNDSSRSFRELADLEFLMNLPDVDLEAMRKTMEHQGFGHYYAEIEARRGRD